MLEESKIMRSLTHFPVGLLSVLLVLNHKHFMRHKAIRIRKHQVLRSNKLIKMVYDGKNANLFLFHQQKNRFYLHFNVSSITNVSNLMGFHSMEKFAISTIHTGYFSWEVHAHIQPSFHNHHLQTL